MQMKVTYSLLKFTALLCICCTILFIISIAGATEVVQQGVLNTNGCSLLDGQKPSIYLIRDTVWDEPETTRIILRNNSSCRIILTTTGKQTLVKPRGKISQSPDPVAD